jgi:ATP-dependent helicase Lhr and Lhr-like helicase
VEAFGPAARAWFAESFERPTPVQELGWREIAAGRNALLLAPTGSGKTLAAFLWAIDRLSREPEAEEAGVRVLYVSPLKALVYDIERNLRAPLVGVRRTAERLGDTARSPRVAVRTGDTPAKERAAQARDPAEILVTTPESLYLILGSAQRATLRSVETVIVDEIHSLAPTKRGAHLALSLERVAALAARDPQRIGLSATARPIGEVARFLGGDRPVAIVDTSEPPKVDLEIRVPTADMTRPIPGPAREKATASKRARAADTGRSGSLLGELAARELPDPALGMWPAIEAELLADVRAHRSTIVFVNSRGLCERLAQRLNELAGEELVRAHHGSIAAGQRREIEEALKDGRLRGIVATSSLELGIDMGAVDLVLLVESPGAVSRGLQRVGRAGHKVGEVSKARIYPKHRGDLLEASVVIRGMEAGAVEALRVPRNPLDVLAQQIVAAVGVEPWTVPDLERMVRRAAPYRELSREALVGVLDMLSGRYPSTDFAELRPRLVWDRESDVLRARQGAAKIALVSGGTIPDRGLFPVRVGTDGPRVGELDEEMVYETRVGQTLTLGATTWRVAEITRDRVIVSPAPGEVGRLPFWKGDGPGRPIELGRALGAFVRELGEMSRAEAIAWLKGRGRLDELAAGNLADYVAEQRETTGTLPTDRAITIERFRDELGDWRVCILSPFGSRIHAPWALAIEASLSRDAGYEVQTLWSDDGVVLRFADAERLPDREILVPEPEEVEDRVVEQLGQSALFAAQFRENAARALLLPRRRPGARTPLFVQRLRAQNLLAVARQFPSFPIVLETYRACLQDVFDLSGLVDLLRAIRSREVRIEEVETSSASPFARSLVFAWTAAYLYQGDTPAAERRAQALTLDRAMLRDLLGQEQLRDLLDATAIAAVEAELQDLGEERAPAHPDTIADRLRRLGDLTEMEIALRALGDPGEALGALEAARRAVRVRIAGETRWVAAEDAALYRDALGVVPPAGLPAALLEPARDPLEQLVGRYARTHGPFPAERLARRYGLLPAQVEPVLAGLETRGKILSGEFHPAGHTREWCDAEVLRRIRRRTLARLRGEVAPVDAAGYARFLPTWHGVGGGGAPGKRLDEALAQLEGAAVPFSDLERAILPARVPGFEPRLLDERGALGQVVWVGHGSLGERDGRVALYRRERVPLLLEAAEAPAELAALPRALLDHLGRRGACFFAELVGASGGATEKDVLAALWDLVWFGLATNDTFAPLRALAHGSAKRRPGRNAPSAAAGRWSRVADLVPDPVEPTRRAHARALVLLDRYGVLSREALLAEEIAGGFGAVYPVLRAMEEAGKLRRGHFVDGLDGAQFAFAGAVDQLRTVRSASGAPDARLLAASDPANPYGALLPWPSLRDPAAGRPRRAAGAVLVLVDGAPALFLERSLRHALSFAALGEGEPAALAAEALRGLFADRRRRGVRIERIDGAEALASPLRAAFVRAGFRAEYKGLVLDRFVSAAPAAPDVRRPS